MDAIELSIEELEKITAGASATTKEDAAVIVVVEKLISMVKGLRQKVCELEWELRSKVK